MADHLMPRASRWRVLRERILRDDGPPSSWPVALALLVFTPLTYCTMFLPKNVAEWLVEEEHPIEALGVLGLLAGMVACFVMWWEVRGDPAWPRLRRLSLFGFGLLLFILAGEEESWGQRLLGIETPPSISEINAQHETNLHNLTALHAINSYTLFASLLFAVGVLAPVLALWAGPRRRLEKFMPILPIALSTMFIYNQVLYWGFHRLFIRIPAAYHAAYPCAYSLGEIKETFGELVLGLGFVFILAKRRHHQRSIAEVLPSAFSTRP